MRFESRVHVDEANNPHSSTPFPHHRHTPHTSLSIFHIKQNDYTPRPSVEHDCKIQTPSNEVRTKLARFRWKDRVELSWTYSTPAELYYLEYLLDAVTCTSPSVHSIHRSPFSQPIFPAPPPSSSAFPPAFIPPLLYQRLLTHSLSKKL